MSTRLKIKKSWYIIPRSKFNCEPNLGKRNLYFNVSEKKLQKFKFEKKLNCLFRWEKNLLQISKVINQPIKKILKEMKLLLKKGLKNKLTKTIFNLHVFK